MFDKKIGVLLAIALQAEYACVEFFHKFLVKITNFTKIATSFKCFPIAIHFYELQKKIKEIIKKCN